MLTLLGILGVIGIISTYRINKSCKEQNRKFNPLDGSLWEWLGFLFGIVFPSIFAISGIIFLIVKYLP
jgi:hypothetical protein